MTPAPQQHQHADVKLPSIALHQDYPSDLKRISMDFDRNDTHKPSIRISRGLHAACTCQAVGIKRRIMTPYKDALSNMLRTSTSCDKGGTHKSIMSIRMGFKQEL